MSNLKMIAAIVLSALSACTSTGVEMKSVATSGNSISVNKSVTGVWILSVNAPQGTFDATMHLVQEGTKLTGRSESEIGDATLAGSINGTAVAWSIVGVDRAGQAVPNAPRFDFAGVVQSDAMNGKANFASLGEGTWSATRVKNQ